MKSNLPNQRAFDAIDSSAGRIFQDHLFSNRHRSWDLGEGVRRRERGASDFPER